MKAFNIRPVRLPIEDHKDEIIEAVRRHQFVIIFGETGSGKTTKIPQYLYEAGINSNKTIVVTQPRRIAAMSMAKFVAEEMDCYLGLEVGYEIRFDNKSTIVTKIKYMTDGILLNHCVADITLRQYGVVMIDEAHERTIYTDVMLGLIKQICHRRNDLKIIISSATMNTVRFFEYFQPSCIINFDGKLFPVEVIYEPSSEPEYLIKIVEIIRRIHDGCEEGDILAFLTSQEEIEYCCKVLKNTENLVVLPLFSSMEYEKQIKIFDEVDENQRKAIISTNIAETSLTIDGVRFVIDCGYVKENRFDFKLGITELKAVQISKAQADQRKGRAGRTNSGWCYRIYTERGYRKFNDETTPEIYRRNLSEIFLKLAALDIDPIRFNFIDKPTADRLKKCKDELQECHLLDSRGDITDDGMQIANLPVYPVIGQVLLKSERNGCAMDVITILSMLAERYIFRWTNETAKLVNERKKQFFDRRGDYFVFLNVYSSWIDNGKSKEWCDENFINFQKMETVEKARSQLIGIMKSKEMALDSVYTNQNSSAIEKSFASVYCKNICRYISSRKYENISNGMILYIHPGSALIHQSCPLVLYNEVVQTTQPYMHGVISVSEDILKQVRCK